MTASPAYVRWRGADGNVACSYCRHCNGLITRRGEKWLHDETNGFGCPKLPDEGAPVITFDGNDAGEPTFGYVLEANEDAVNVRFPAQDIEDFDEDGDYRPGQLTECEGVWTDDVATLTQRREWGETLSAADVHSILAES